MALFMKVVFGILIFFITCSSAIALTLDSGGNISLPGDRTDSGNDSSEGSASAEYNVFVNGNLFIDYSVFGESEDLFIGANVSITGDTITIFSFSDDPTPPDFSMLTILLNLENSIDETGEVLLFSHAPILDGAFEATGDVFIGNYANFKPVPLPASVVFLLSGLFFLVSRIKSKVSDHISMTAFAP